MYTSTIIATLIAFAVSTAIAPAVIPFLRKLKIGQTVRDDGPQTHLQKTGTPTMGGAMIIIGFIAGCLYFSIENPRLLPIMALTFGFGIIGFLDDYIKVVRKKSEGLKPWQKMTMQFLVCGAYVTYMYFASDVPMAMKVPFLNGVTIDLGIFSIPFMFIVILGTDTGANFTDGLDGLASSVTAVIAAFLAVCALILRPDVAPVAGAMIGALLSFLLFNAHPAKVFMGDTGSLAIGGFVAALAYELQMPIFLVIIAFIYVAEVASVIMQVSYFKITKGKRIFKMAPIHHHFELCGWKETKVVAVFTIVTVILCLISFLGVW